MDQPQKAKTFVFGASKLTPNPTDRRKITPDADRTQHRNTNPEYSDSTARTQSFGYYEDNTDDLDEHDNGTPMKGPDKLYRQIPWDFLQGKTPKFRGMCRYYFSAPPNIFHNFVSFHPILMFLTILESGDKTNNIGDEFKTIRLILINSYRYLVSFYSFSEMKTYFGLWKKI